METTGTDNALVTPEAQQLATEADTICQQAGALKIDSPDMYDLAGNELKIIKAQQKALNDLRKSITQPMDAAKKVVMDFFRAPGDNLSRAESGIKRAMLSYQDEQDRKARIAQAEADERARKERERLEKRAQQAEAKGKNEKAEELREQAETTPAPFIPAPQAPQVKGVATKVTWSAEVTDLRALLQGIIDGKVPENAVKPDMTVLNGMARSLKEHLNYPGVKAVSTKGISAGSR